MMMYCEGRTVKMLCALQGFSIGKCRNIENQMSEFSPLKKNFIFFYIYIYKRYVFISSSAGKAIK